MVVFAIVLGNQKIMTVFRQLILLNDYMLETYFLQLRVTWELNITISD